jgi:hypothetical protein
MRTTALNGSTDIDQSLEKDIGGKLARTADPKVGLAKLVKTNNSSVRCPKCSEPMRLVEDAPHFGQFLSPWRGYRCDPCRIALSYPDEDEDVRRV